MKGYGSETYGERIAVICDELFHAPTRPEDSLEFLAGLAAGGPGSSSRSASEGSRSHCLPGALSCMAAMPPRRWSPSSAPSPAVTWNVVVLTVFPSPPLHRDQRKRESEGERYANLERVELPMRGSRAASSTSGPMTTASPRRSAVRHPCHSLCVVQSFRAAMLLTTYPASLPTPRKNPDDMA